MVNKTSSEAPQKAPPRPPPKPPQDLLDFSFTDADAGPQEQALKPTSSSARHAQACPPELPPQRPPRPSAPEVGGTLISGFLSALDIGAGGDGGETRVGGFGSGCAASGGGGNPFADDDDEAGALGAAFDAGGGGGMGGVESGWASFSTEVRVHHARAHARAHTHTHNEARRLEARVNIQILRHLLS